MSIYNLSDTKAQLVNSNRDYNNQLTWQNSYNAAGIAAARAADSLDDAYNNAVIDAYKSHLDTESDIKNSGIVNNSTMKELLRLNQNSLDEAYASYMSKYQEGANEINASYSEQVENINALLEQQAQNTIDLADSAYGYLQSEYDRYIEELQSYNELYSQNELGQYVDADGNVVENFKGQFDDPTWNKYLQHDENGNLVYDEDGNPVLRSYNDIYSTFSRNGQATIEGYDFFKQMLNDNFATDHSFDNYLKESNPELYDWATSYNPYNYTAKGDNVGTFKELVGIDSIDGTYSFLDAAGGMNSQQIIDIFTENNEQMSQLATIDLTTKEGQQQAVDIVNSSTTGLIDIALDLGYADELSEMGISKDSIQQFSDKIQSIIDNGTSALSEKELMQALEDSGIVLEGDTAIAAESALITGISTATGALTGTAAGAIAGGVIGAGAASGIFGTALGATLGIGLGVGGLAIGALVGAVVGGVISASANSTRAEDKNRKENATMNYAQDLIHNFQDMYNDSVELIVNDALQRKRQTEIDKGLFVNPYEVYEQNTYDQRVQSYNALKNKTLISTFNTADTSSYQVGSVITDANGNNWEVSEVITNDSAKANGYDSGDSQLTNIIGSDDFDTKDGHIVKGALEDTYYVALDGIGNWAIVKPSEKQQQETNSNLYKNYQPNTIVDTSKYTNPNSLRKGVTISGANGTKFKVTEVTSNDYAKSQGYKNGDDMMSKLTGITSHSGKLNKDGNIVYAGNGKFYMALDGLGTWAILELA